MYNSYNKCNREVWVHNSSGIITHKLGKEWDESFVLIFPLKGIPNGYTRSDVETAIGNMLIGKMFRFWIFLSYVLKGGR